MILGTAGNDTIGVGTTTAGDDVVRARGGDDSVEGLAGNDRLYGADGDDTLIGGLGHDSLFGGLGADTMFGGDGDDRFYVDDANDQVLEASDNGADTLFLRVSYVLAAGVSIEKLRILDTTGLMVTGNALDNLLIGGIGADMLDTGAGDDLIRAGAGNDTITTSGASARIDAGVGDDTIRIDGASTSAGRVNGGSGYDTVRSADLGEFVFHNVEVLDTYYGFLTGSVKQLNSFDSYTADLAAPDAQISISLRGVGGSLDFTTAVSAQNSVEIRDAGLTSKIFVTGSTNADILFGSAFHDTLNGGNGDDQLFAGNGRDILNGGDGADRLNGGSGSDTLTGGDGSDVFVFDSPIGGGTNVDRIADFTPGSDIIEIYEDYVFAGLTLGSLAPSQFAVDSATGSGPQIVYNASTGALFYDNNGAEAGGASQFAVLTAVPALAASDFLIV